MSMPIKIPLYPEFAKLTYNNKLTFFSLSNILLANGGGGKSVNKIDMETHYAIFTVRIPLSFKFLG